MIGVGVIGCGTISGVYLKNGPRLEHVRYVACADADPARAQAAADEHGLDACSLDELYAHPDVEVVLCLTPPDSHAEVLLRALEAGRHAHSEKPLATSVEDARGVLDTAARLGRLVGCAPDTFLGAGVQTLRRALEDGAIGEPAVARIQLLSRPPESWHPSPAFLYAPLAGPLLDVGPYAVTVAIELFGRVARVTALGTRPRTSGTTLDGDAFEIAEPTRVAAVLEHESGVLTTVIVTFDADGSSQSGIAVTGRGGTLLGGDPNRFGGPVSLDGEELPLVNDWTDNARGLGLDDLCRAVETGAPQRASGERGLQVLEVLLQARRQAGYP